MNHRTAKETFDRPDRKSSPPPRMATENGRPDAGSWSLVTASRVMVGEFLSLMC
ncbi:MAG: hypothetical protein ACM3ML_36085 [Micromonosporaceae bacterium]